MTQDERHEFCIICSNMAFDKSKGIVCGLTNKKADFNNKCLYFDTTKQEDLITLQTKSWQERKNKRIENLKYNKIVRNYRRFYFLLSLFLILLGIFHTRENGNSVDHINAWLYSLAIVFFIISYYAHFKPTGVIIISSIFLFIFILVVILFLLVWILFTKTGFSLIYSLLALGSAFVSIAGSLNFTYKLFMKRKKEDMEKNESM
jgi:hypothetical protein